MQIIESEKYMTNVLPDGFFLNQLNNKSKKISVPKSLENGKKTLNNVEEVEKVWLTLSMQKLQTWDKNCLNIHLKLVVKGFYGRQNVFSLPIEN